MSTNAVVRARVDQQVKADAAEVLADMGLTLSDAFRLLLRRVARDKALPFEPFEPGPVTIAAMQEARAGEMKRFNTIEELIADLNADD